MQRESASPLAGNPVLGILGKKPLVMNENEFILPAPATAALKMAYGDQFLEGLRQGEVRTMSDGGFIDNIAPPPMVAQSYGLSGAGKSSSMSASIQEPRRDNITVQYQEINGQKLVTIEQLDQIVGRLQGDINQKATLDEAVTGTVETFRRDLGARNAIGI